MKLLINLLAIVTVAVAGSEELDILARRYLGLLPQASYDFMLDNDCEHADERADGRSHVSIYQRYCAKFVAEKTRVEGIIVQLIDDIYETLQTFEKQRLRFNKNDVKAAIHRQFEITRGELSDKIYVYENSYQRFLDEFEAEANTFVAGASRLQSLIINRV